MGHPGPITITISAARPASPVGSAIKPINVLSEPHENCKDTAGGSPSAATRLQQTLDKARTRAFIDTKLDNLEVDHAQVDAGYTTPTGSNSSIRVATTAAREMVAGLFSRRKKSFNSLSDGTSHISKSPASSLITTIPTDDSDEEYLYNVPTFGPAPARDPSSARRKKLKLKAPHMSDTDEVRYITFPPFDSSAPAKQASVRPTKGIPISKGKQVEEDSQSAFSALTLTQNRCNNKIRATRAQKSSTSTPRTTAQEVFKNDSHVSTSQPKICIVPETPPTPKSKVRHKSEPSSLSGRGAFCSPAGVLIRQNSAYSSISAINDTPVATLSREVSSAGSGTVALTNVLISPQFGTSAKITSLTAPMSYKLLESDGYVSFPPYVPSSYFSSSIANLFGRNGSSISLNLEPDAPEDKSHGVVIKPRLRRTLRSLAASRRRHSVSTQGTALEELGEGIAK